MLCTLPLIPPKGVSRTPNALGRYPNTIYKPSRVPLAKSHAQEYGTPERYPNDSWPDSLKERPSSLALHDTIESRGDCLFLHNLLRLTYGEEVSGAQWAGAWGHSGQ